MLDEERATLNLMQFDTVTGSSSFHCIVFFPGRLFQSTKIDIAYVTRVKLIMGHMKNSKIIQLMLDTLTRLI